MMWFLLIATIRSVHSGQPWLQSAPAPTKLRSPRCGARLRACRKGCLVGGACRSALRGRSPQEAQAAGCGDRLASRRSAVSRKKLGGHAGGERLDVLGRQCVATKAPGAARDLLDDDPGDRAHVFTFDRTILSVRPSMISRFWLGVKTSSMSLTLMSGMVPPRGWIGSPRAQSCSAISGCAGSSKWRRRAASPAIAFRSRNFAIA